MKMQKKDWTTQLQIGPQYIPTNHWRRVWCKLEGLPWDAGKTSHWKLQRDADNPQPENCCHQEKD